MNEEVKELFESYQAYLHRVPVGCGNIVEMLRKNFVAEALNDVKDFSEGMMWLLDATALLKSNEVDILFDVFPIIDFLEEINEGLTNQDYLLVADLFEYEIIPFFEKLISELTNN